jgi:hypothetical protein
MEADRPQAGGEPGRIRHHREERSDAAIQGSLDRFAALAVTETFSSKMGRRSSVARQTADAGIVPVNRG